MPRLRTAAAACETSDHPANCNCYQRAQPAAQSLEELDFLKSACGAAQKGDVSKLQRLLCQHPDWVSSDGMTGQSGYTPLHYASREGRIEAVQLLLQAGADPNKATRAGAATSLHRAAYMGHLPVVELLVKHGANGNLQDADGETALHKAAAQGHLRVAQLLAKRFPDARHLRDRKGHTPAEAAQGDVRGQLQ